MTPPRKTKSIIRPRLLRYWVCLQLQAARAPMKVRDLVKLFEESPFTVGGRTSKVISDSLRWATPRGWVHAMGRGEYRPGRIPESTQRFMRQKLNAAEPSGDPSWVKTQERKLASRLNDGRVRACEDGPFRVSL